MSRKSDPFNRKRRKIRLLIILMAVFTVLLSVFCLFVGSSHMTFSDCIHALLRTGSASEVRIIWNIRIPRILAALIAGAGLSVSGLIMQTTLNNALASPSVLGVSNAAVFGANLSIIAFAGGFLSTGNNLSNYMTGSSPYAVSGMAFLFSAASVLLILGLCRVRSFSPNVVVLAGIAIGAVWTAATTILQFYATDVGLSAAVIWSFGDLGRATYRTDLIMLTVTVIGIVCFSLGSWKYNALLSGDETAKSLGVNTSRVRFWSMLSASLLTAVSVSFMGMIGFIGLIGPQIMKRIVGSDHRFLVPGSALLGSVILLAADTCARTVISPIILPVGAITSLLGAPMFFYMLLKGKRAK